MRAVSGSERRFPIGFSRASIGQRAMPLPTRKSSFIARSKPVGNRRSVLVAALPRCAAIRQNLRVARGFSQGDGGAGSGSERRFPIGFGRASIGQRTMPLPTRKSSFIVRSKPVGNRRSVLVAALPRCAVSFSRLLRRSSLFVKPGEGNLLEEPLFRGGGRAEADRSSVETLIALSMDLLPVQ